MPSAYNLQKQSSITEVVCLKRFIVSSVVGKFCSTGAGVHLDAWRGDFYFLSSSCCLLFVREILNPGDEYKAAFKGDDYEAEVLAVGEFSMCFIHDNTYA